ncbi:MAG: DNA topoisomerase VI subunit B [Nanoarchaeota archaeon]|nr:DNA topoisomerase VI subunit B [Nanoarchaeota archaeon]MCG2718406.1 DNA topoisomerase VI subunit B [Nanoarchaeota archaeon]
MVQTKLTTVSDKKKRTITKAEELAKGQREISVAEFFTKNRHLLGFDNPRKALLTTVKEAVDNSLDACEEMNVLPDVSVKIIALGGKEASVADRFVVTIEDNGPGVVKKQIPNIFAKLLYGSKFHSMKQSRGQQGIGISAAGMYGQLTTGKPVKITSKIDPKRNAMYYELHIDTQKNEPEILKEEEVEWEKDHGTKVTIELEAKYVKGKQSVDEYLKQTAIANPHVTLTYISPEKKKTNFPRVTEEMPAEAKSIKPHPYGVELGILMKMLKSTKAKNLQAFLKKDFSRVSPKIAKEICDKAGVYEKSRPSRIATQEADNLFKAINITKIMAPPTNCLVPIGKDLIEKGLKKEIDADFYIAVTRPPAVYRGNPFQIEVGLAYGGDIPSDHISRVIRFANRVPLLYQQSSGAVFKAILGTNWRNYSLSQSKGALPTGPLIIMVNIASVWVPFTSESKEAIAHYPQIIKEMKLALQEAGRQLSIHIRKRKHAEHEEKKKSYIEKYLPHVGIALKEILNLKQTEEQKVEVNLKKILEKHRE